MELISREKLKEVIEPMVGKFDDDGEFWWTRESILRAIDNAPAVEERKEGRWIEVKITRGGHECSECHNYAPSYQSGSELLSNYCPNCGAKMKGE